MKVNKKWEFNDAEDTGVLTTKQVVDGKKPIIYVSHDGEDGEWEFYGENLDAKNAVIIPFKTIVDLDKTLNDLADLPCGWVATRSNKNEPWKREQNED